MPPLNSPKRLSIPPDSQLGEWQDGVFKFSSPEAEQRWAVDAYRSGVHATDWHRGTPVDDKTRDLVLNDLGGPTAPMFRGPDGQYRFANAQTVEPHEIRDHRRRAFQGTKAANLHGPEMPGEDVIAARHAKSVQAVPPPANDNMQPPKPKTGIGRFAHMAAAQKEAGYLSPQEVLQHIDDGVRLLANGATLGYADNIAAAGNALFNVGEGYDGNLSDEKERTQTARQRSGKVGAVIESAPQMVPGYGDLLSLANDAKTYIEDPGQITPQNIGATIFTALPFTPNILAGVKKVDDAIETTARVEAKVVNKTDDAADVTKVGTDIAPAFDPADAKSIDAYFKRPLKGNEGPEGHVIAKHVGKTKEELLKRYDTDKSIPSSSSFYDYEAAERTIQGALRQNQDAIVEWMQAPKQNALRIRFHGADNVGISVSRDGKVLQMNTATIVITKNKKGGFDFLTAFPGE